MMIVAFLTVSAFLAASNPAFRWAAKMLIVDERAWPDSGPEYRGSPDWAAATPVLSKLAEHSDVVITSAGVKALYFLGDFDFDLSATNVREKAREFRIDERTGRRLISTVSSMRMIYDCYASGLMIIEARHWRNAWAVSPSVADFIEASGDRVELPLGTHLVAFTWRRHGSVGEQECAERLLRET